MTFPAPHFSIAINTKLHCAHIEKFSACSICEQHDNLTIEMNSNNQKTLAMCVGIAAHAERLWQRVFFFGYFLLDKQKKVT